MIEPLNAALSGRYRIQRELGEGGMARVFLAEDLRHGRNVAIKVLKPELAAVVGAERFLAEIETTAKLQHPHILPLFDSGAADGFLYYVMPYVEGESLRDRLDREKQLPLDEAVAIAVKVAGALQEAHDRGVVHRDIKPGNILLARGEPLVADFGIALALQEAGGGRLTETGLSLGTPYYMSPEQATADRDPDARSDMYSLAAVLYEMLTGDPPHTASTTQAVIAKILSKDPAPVRESRRAVPDYVDAAVARALERLPADRFASAAEFAAALEGRQATTGGRGAWHRPVRSGRMPWPWVALAAMFAALAAWGWLRPSPDAPAQPPTHLAVPLPNLGGAATGELRQLALTPDGSTLLYTAIAPDGENRTLRRRLDETESTVVPGVVPFLAQYTVSSDGREFIGFTPQGGRVHRYPIEGGAERPLPDGIPQGWAAWDPDGGLWFSTDVRDQGLLRITPEGDLTVPFGDRFADFTIQQILPHRRALVSRAPRGTSSGPLLMIDLETGDTTTVIGTNVVEARWTEGYLVFAEPDGSLWAVGLDPAEGRPAGDPVRIADGVLVEAGIAQLAVADNGTVAYIPEEPRSLVLMDRDGRQRTATAEGRNFHAPSFSPDGGRISVDFNSDDGRNVWVLDVDEGVPIRATFDPNGHDARWTPDGQAITYLADLDNGDFGIFRTRPGSVDSDSILADTALTFTGTWLRDGSALVTTADGLAASSGGDIAIVREGGRGPVEPLVATRFNEGWPSVSADDRWLAYVSDQSGRAEVYVRALEGGDPVQVSLDGGYEPVWGRDGRELFYRAGPGSGTRLVAATIRTDPTPAVETRQPLFSVADIATASPHPNYDVAPDGRTFVMVRFNPSSRVMVIQNLPALVRKRGGR